MIRHDPSSAHVSGIAVDSTASSSSPSARERLLKSLYRHCVKSIGDSTSYRDTAYLSRVIQTPNRHQSTSRLPYSAINHYEVPHPDSGISGRTINDSICCNWPRHPNHPRFKRADPNNRERRMDLRRRSLPHTSLHQSS
jgi:hypothetical protein